MLQEEKVILRAVKREDIGNPAYRGRGYGRDALRLLLDYAFRIQHMHKVALTVNTEDQRASAPIAPVALSKKAACASMPGAATNTSNCSA